MTATPSKINRNGCCVPISFFSEAKVCTSAQQVCVQLPTSADNVTLLALAAENQLCSRFAAVGVEISTICCTTDSRQQVQAVSHCQLT